MDDTTELSRQRAMRFLRQERREIEVSTSSSFAQSSAAYSENKWKTKGATSASIFSELTGLPTDHAASDSQPQAGKPQGAQTLPETNIGFKLLKKSGWKEGSGLGASEQGRLNPVEAQHKLDRRGIGSERKYTKRSDGTVERRQSNEDERETKKSKQEKNMSRKALKKQVEAKQIQEAAFAREFYREFWPENV